MVFPARSALFNHNILNTKAISHFQANHILIRFVFPPLNSITPGKPMVITIRIEDEYLSVSNPIHPKKSVASSGIGLENLAKRCELMSGKKIIIKNETEKFTVKVPLLYE